jgi:predicted ATPase/class 3 adenylate cyclase
LRRPGQWVSRGFEVICRGATHGQGLSLRCPNCNAINPPQARFCNECGLSLAPPEPATPPAPVLAGAHAERRQLTCLFCDLEDSVQLSERLDPEELRDVLAAYQQVCATVIRRFEGHIARYFGDGIMVYFGFPRAHEDEAQRAVRSGLGIVQGVSQLSSRLQRERGIHLRVRIGIHTGLVVAGDIAPGQQLEAMAAIGETPNIAARLQALAEPDSIVISAATYGLIAGYFNCRELGPRPLRGISQPLAIYPVLNESGARTRLDVAALRGLPPMAGREAELRVLTESWREAASGEGKAVLVSGEPGIGKSRLIWALEEYVAQFPEPSLAKLSCSPYYQNTAFYPVVDFLGRVILQFAPDDTVEQRLDKIDGYLAQQGLSLPAYAPLFADLLSVPFEQRYPRPDVPANRGRQLLIDAIIRTILLRAEQQPLLFVLEDLHWADPSSLDILAKLIEHLPSARLLLVVSCRPEFVAPWFDHPGVQNLILSRLDRDASAAIVTQIAGKPLPTELLGKLLGGADGIALYLEELTKLVLELGVLRQTNDHFELTGALPPMAIPASLADSLMARLDRLTTAKEIAQLGSTIGRQFSYDLLTAVLRSISGPIDKLMLERDLARLVDSGLLIGEERKGAASYTFKHALIQEAAYRSLLNSTRQTYHRIVGETLVEHFPDTVEVEPELLAYHYTEAGLGEQALVYWQKAGQRSVERSANAEAIAQLRKALEILASLPATDEHVQQELVLQLALGAPLMAMKGYSAPEVGQALGRARALCRRIGETLRLFPVLWGLWVFYVVRTEFGVAQELAAECLELARQAGDPGLLLEAHVSLGTTLFYVPDHASARAHMEQAIEIYDPLHYRADAFVYGQDPGMVALGYVAKCLALLGYADRARQRGRELLDMADSLSTHHNSYAATFMHLAVLHLLLWDATLAREFAEKMTAIAEEHDLLLWLGMGRMLAGAAVIQQGCLANDHAQIEAGMMQTQQGMADYRATGAGLDYPHCLVLLARGHAELGQVEQGLEVLAGAQRVIDDTGQRYYEAELYRVRGELLVADSGAHRAEEAEACFRHALDVAANQSAKLLELRAIMSLARHQQTESDGVSLQQELAKAFAWFTEGFDTFDLQQASALLQDWHTATLP